MKKSDSKPSKETPEQELKRLRKRVAKLESQKESIKDENKALKKELKKKDVPKVTLTEEQLKLLSSLCPGIDSLFK